MPELAEVEYFRKVWDCGLRTRVTAVRTQPQSRVLRGIDLARLRSALVGAKLNQSAAHGKQMLFRFSGGVWLGIHLGMTGELRAAPAGFEPGKFDRLILCQRRRALVFHDVRQFGRVRFHEGESPPAWWSDLPPAVLSDRFTQSHFDRLLQRHRRLAVKAVLLLQDGFPGIGNWMADEALWRGRIAPRRVCGEIAPAERSRLRRALRFVVREALRTVGHGAANPPESWLFQQRWGNGGMCPRHRGTALDRATVGGRTTAWCPQCQP